MSKNREAKATRQGRCRRGARGREGEPRSEGARKNQRKSPHHATRAQCRLDEVSDRNGTREGGLHEDRSIRKRATAKQAKVKSDDARYARSRASPRSRPVRRPAQGSLAGWSPCAIYEASDGRMDDSQDLWQAFTEADFPRFVRKAVHRTSELQNPPNPKIIALFLRLISIT